MWMICSTLAEAGRRAGEAERERKCSADGFWNHRPATTKVQRIMTLTNL